MASNLSTIEPGESAGEQLEERARLGQRRRIGAAFMVSSSSIARRRSVPASCLLHSRRHLRAVDRPDPDEFVSRPHEAPSLDYWFGTTGSGEDVFSQTVWGTRTSLGAGLIVGVAVTIIGASSA